MSYCTRPRNVLSYCTCPRKRVSDRTTFASWSPLKNHCQPFSFSTSTEQMAILENLQNASHSKYTKYHLQTNTCNSEQKIKCWHSDFHEIIDRNVVQKLRQRHQFLCNVTFLALTLANISRQRRSFAYVVIWWSVVRNDTFYINYGQFKGRPGQEMTWISIWNHSIAY